MIILESTGRISDAMKTMALVFLCAAGAQAFALGLPRANARAAVRMADVETAPPAGFQWATYDQECVVEAENAAEIADCQGAPIPEGLPAPKASSTKPKDGVVDANAADMKMGYNNKNIDECLVDAENAAEVQDCNNDYDEVRRR